MTRVLVLALLAFLTSPVLAAPKPANAPYPGVELVIPVPDGPVTKVIRLVNMTGVSNPDGTVGTPPLEMLRVYDEGNCTTPPGCRFYNNQNYKFGVIQVDAPSNRPLFYTADYDPFWRWCYAPSCVVVPIWIYTIYYAD